MSAAVTSSEVARVVARVADVGEGDVGEVLTRVLAHREQVAEALRRVPLVGEAVPHRHARMLGELLDCSLASSAILDPVVDPPQHPRRVRRRLLVADLRAGRVEVRDVGALVVRGHLERRARPGRGLLEDQREVEPLEHRHLHAAPSWRP